MPPGTAPPAVIRPYALIDANHFYVSCERVFDYQLRDWPVSECRRAQDAKRDIPVPLSPCARRQP